MSLELKDRLKKTILQSSKKLGCKMSEFQVTNSGKKRFIGSNLFWADLTWGLDNNLHIHLEIDKKRQVYRLKQTFKKQPENLPVRWGKELPPTFQFSPEGVRVLTWAELKQIIQQFNLPEEQLQFINETKNSNNLVFQLMRGKGGQVAHQFRSSSEQQEPFLKDNEDYKL